jgi:hypothetical protein
LTNLLVCIYEMDNAALAFYQGAEMLDEAWEKKDWNDALGGAIAIFAGVQGVEQGLPTCESVDTKSKNWKDLDRLVQISQGKETTLKIVEDNMVFNGVTITKDFIATVKNYRKQDYKQFGYMFGETMMTATATENNLFLY